MRDLAAAYVRYLTEGSESDAWALHRPAAEPGRYAPHDTLVNVEASRDHV